MLNAVPRYDVLTVRNPLREHTRDALFGLHLRFVLDELNRNGHPYNVIHCSFCRGSALGIPPITALNK